MSTNTTVVGARLATPKAVAGPWREAAGRLFKNKLAIVGLVLVLLLLFCGIFGPMLAPWPYQVQDLPAVFANGGRPLPPLSPNHGSRVPGSVRPGRRGSRPGQVSPSGRMQRSHGCPASDTRPPRVARRQA